jgi:flagellar assembly protein FliH
MNESSKNILKGAKIEGTVFCNPQKPKEVPNGLGSSVGAEYKRGLEDGRQQGYEAGRLEGLEMGFQQGRAIAQDQFKHAIGMLNLIAASFQIQREELFKQMKPEIIKFNINLMEKLLQQELKNPDVFISLIEKLLQQVESVVKDVSINVVVSPEDGQLLKTRFKALGLPSQALSRINLMEESTIERGSCRLETSLGMLNYDIPRLMKDLEIKVLEVERA